MDSPHSKVCKMLELSPKCVFGFAPTPTQSCDDSLFAADCSASSDNAKSASVAALVSPHTGVVRTRSLLSELLADIDACEEEDSSECAEDSGSEDEVCGETFSAPHCSCNCGVGTNVRRELHAKGCRFASSEGLKQSESQLFHSGCSSPTSLPVPIPTKTYYRNQAFIEERAKLQYQRTVYRMQLERQQAEQAGAAGL